MRDDGAAASRELHTLTDDEWIGYMQYAFRLSPAAAEETRRRFAARRKAPVCDCVCTYCDTAVPWRECVEGACAGCRHATRSVQLLDEEVAAIQLCIYAAFPSGKHSNALRRLLERSGVRRHKEYIRNGGTR